MILDTLIIQNSYECLNHCKGCYLKDRNQTQELDTWTLYEAIRRFYNPCWSDLNTKQIILSINKYSDRMIIKSHDLFRFIYSLEKLLKNVKKVKLDVTFNDIEDATQYELFLYKCNMVSISNLTFEQAMEFKVKLAFLNKSTTFNFNHLIPRNLTNNNISSYVENLIKIGDIVDSIYLVIFKDTMKKLDKFDINNFKKQQSRLIYDLSVINILNNRLPKRIWDKITIDRCLTDCIEYGKTGHGCSANISKMTLWPDGTSTGCPYAEESEKLSSQRLNCVIDGMNYTHKKRYDFEDKCYLHHLLKSIKKHK